jgi:hypothetical protein
VLFLVPLVAVLVAGTLASRRWPLAVVAVALVAVPQVATTAHRIVEPLPFPAAREVLSYVRDHRHPGDELWLVDPATPPWRYYAPRLGLQAQRQLDWVVPPATCPQPLEPRNATGRVWVVHAYTYHYAPGTTGRLVRSQLDAVARRLDTHVATDASAALYDFSRAPTDPRARHVDRRPDRRCLRATDLAP